MRTGYIVSVKDNEAEDTAFKVIIGDKDKTETRRIKLVEAYKAVEGNFSILTDSQYSELPAEDFISIVVSPQNIDKDYFHNLGDVLDYILTDTEDGNWLVEVYKQDFEQLSNLLVEAGIEFRKK